ncbi:hypothetical protein R4227_06020 [Gordonia amicalis]|uniref:hypothetical protein n=1 Tax=Gordonia amicalis TaxID=89053 RepID=UPI0029535F11|nr:hypothetical protein [Gordonia amicalis]MDV7099698.1 hypothetical protein [Gordonia amicalis]
MRLLKNRRRDEQPVETTPDRPAPEPAGPDTDTDKNETDAATPAGRFDADAIAATVLSEYLTDRSGHLTMLLWPWPETYWRPNDRGAWDEVPRRRVDGLIGMAGTAAGYRMTPPRIEAARDALKVHFAKVPDERMPEVDAEALATPDRPHQPPRTWPTSMPARHEYIEIAKWWVAQRCYRPDGRYVMVNRGVVWQWIPADREWVTCPGTDEWMADLIAESTGFRPDARTVGAARSALAFRGDRPSSTPAEVVAHDVRREIASIISTRASMISRRRPRA